MCHNFSHFLHFRSIEVLVYHRLSRQVDNTTVKKTQLMLPTAIASDDTPLYSKQKILIAFPPKRTSAKSLHFTANKASLTTMQ